MLATSNSKDKTERMLFQLVMVQARELLMKYVRLFRMNDGRCYQIAYDSIDTMKK